jgi:hypothetical protein
MKKMKLKSLRDQSIEQLGQGTYFTNEEKKPEQLTKKYLC